MQLARACIRIVRAWWWVACLAGLPAVGLPVVATAEDDQIAAGNEHWAYQRARRPELPGVIDRHWPRSHIDRFVLARMEAEGLPPAARTERARLIRRVSLALLGLPPTLSEVDAFLADDRPRAYENLVDRLLASPQYGERWAQHWLDLARYADSNGYQADQLRDVWAYRDWVVRALNRDMPFDQFAIEQLAGDLLSDATVEQRIATGFHRTVTCNVEAGVDPEQNRVNQVFDRVNTTATVFLGTTIECCQCHDHKHDPFTQLEYYRLFAFFNNTPLEVERSKDVTFDFVGPKMELPRSKSSQRAYKRMSARLERLQHMAADGDSGGEHGACIKKLKARLAAEAPPSTLVMVEMDQRRVTHLFRRGQYLSKGEPVAAGIPAVLHAFDDSLPANRLGLARWIVSPENPLLARVTVNRWWTELFGRGLVTTPEDFGTHTVGPSHPELLDWLAVEFMESGWSMKHVHKQIVMSATFQQSARAAAAQWSRDPENRLLSRGPRFRLAAETIRDNGLAISGLLSKKMYGPPIMPYQPDGHWQAVGRNQPTWRTATDEDRYRRGLYVVWKRAAPYPSFINFDAPDRAACVVERRRTNTPQQALTLLNDPAFAEMAVALAQRMMLESPEPTSASRAAHGFRLATARRPEPGELNALVALYDSEYERMQQQPDMARKRVERLLPSLRANNVDQIELGAWFAVASVLLNLDESVNL